MNFDIHHHVPYRNDLTLILDRQLRAPLPSHERKQVVLYKSLVRENHGGRRDYLPAGRLSNHLCGLSGSYYL